MIVKKTFNLVRLWPHIKVSMTIAIIWTFIVWGFTHFSGLKNYTLNFTPVSIIGSALAIFIAFKNNTAYQRWWDARSAWELLTTESRCFARVIFTYSKSQQEIEQLDKAMQMDLARTIIYKQIAYVHALRIYLRRLNDWEDLRKFIPEEEYEDLLKSSNIPYKIHLSIASMIRVATTQNLLTWWNTSSLEGSLNNFLKAYGVSEKIKNTPLLRQYDIFTRFFVLIFIILLPFSLLDVFNTLYYRLWLMVPLSLLISFIFIVLERTGAANEDPFENRTTDVPLDSICNIIERDLREILGETELPPIPKPVKGYLW